MCSLQQTQLRIASTSKLIKATLFSGLIFLNIVPAYASDSFQHSMLFSPSEGMILAEAKGRIMIYDGLDIKTVNRAMDEQFDRIDNMMFTRVQHVQENGEIEIEDDGCD